MGACICNLVFDNTVETKGEPIVLVGYVDDQLIFLYVSQVAVVTITQQSRIRMVLLLDLLLQSWFLANLPKFELGGLKNCELAIWVAAIARYEAELP